ncbi:MAG: dihydrodipicolinate synthase family protein [Acidimicrobiia bacterium]|nr:dihydrodipicolinate synthase family protein [Acidimicrobiia bacterium]
MSDTTAKGLSGVWAAGLTPFQEDLRIDHRLLISHVEWLFEDGCHGVLLFGTTGEAMSCSVSERRQALDAVMEAGLDPARILVGTGAAALPDAIELTEHATSHGVAGCLVVPPFYLPDQGPEGVLAGYRALLEGVDATPRLLLYHIPQVSGVAIHDEVITGLGDVVLGIKDSSGVWDNTIHLIEDFAHLAVFRGSEDRISDILDAGAVGVISSTGNIMASAMRQVYDEGIDDSVLTAARLAFAKVPTVSVAKAILAEWTGEPSWRMVRPPLLPATEIPPTIRDALGTLDLSGSRI